MDKNYKEYALMMKALGDETRVKIFDMLSRGELCACNILEEFNITQPTLSYHMKILCDCGLVDSRRDGVWMKYSINKEKLDLVQKLFDVIGNNTDQCNRISCEC
jgi:ArsR family transcriptional regulator